MSKSVPVQAKVMDDNGMLHEIATSYTPRTDNVFEEVESEAKSRGIKVASVVTVSFPVMEAS